MRIASKCPYCEEYNIHKIEKLSNDFSEVVECESCVTEYTIRILNGACANEDTLAWRENEDYKSRKEDRAIKKLSSAMQIQEALNRR